MKRTTKKSVNNLQEIFHLFVFQGEPGEEVSIGSTEGVNGNGGKAKGEKVRRIQFRYHGNDEGAVV